MRVMVEGQLRLAPEGRGGRPEAHLHQAAPDTIPLVGGQFRTGDAACDGLRITQQRPDDVQRRRDAGLWRLQREVLPGATPVLDWWHAAVRFEHALQAARGLEAALAQHTA